MVDALSSEAMGQGAPRFLVICRHVEITNPLGLHLRAAERFVRMAREFQANVRVARDGRKISGRSILDLMTLAAPCGCRLDLEADGPDAEAAVDALSALIERGFDNSDR
jgi:phosphocarrier protein